MKSLDAQEEQKRLSREELLRPRIAERVIFVESLGGEVVFRSMSHNLRQELRKRAGLGTEEWDEDLFTSLCLVHCIIDPKLTEDDIKALHEQDMTVWDELVLQVTLLNMLGHQEELKKDSGETQN